MTSIICSGLIELSELSLKNNDAAVFGIGEFKHSFATVKKTYFNESARRDKMFIYFYNDGQSRKEDSDISGKSVNV
jgi:hypothetical protein